MSFYCGRMLVLGRRQSVVIHLILGREDPYGVFARQRDAGSPLSPQGLPSLPIHHSGDKERSPISKKILVIGPNSLDGLHNGRPGSIGRQPDRRRPAGQAGVLGLRGRAVWGLTLHDRRARPIEQPEALGSLLVGVAPPMDPGPAFGADDMLVKGRVPEIGRVGRPPASFGCKNPFDCRVYGQPSEGGLGGRSDPPPPLAEEPAERVGLGADRATAEARDG
jgi:hypothetical protein